MTRLKSLYVKDFRSINGEVNISLDAPIVLIHGPNGAGKTSLLSAIELALTGAVSSLSRAEPDYLSYLPHKDRPFGEVRLDLAGLDGTVRRTDMRVTTGAVTGQALLTGPEADFFSERSYLAQSTLGRLLEIYQHSEKKNDSPLTRFVKELLGLDRMEALIGGLHSAGNIARLKAPVPAYGENRDTIAAEEAEIAAINQRLSEAETSIETYQSQLSEKLAAFDPDLLEADPAEIISALEAISEDSSLTALVRNRRELEVSRGSWSAAAREVRADTTYSALEEANHTASSAFEKWTFEQGHVVDLLLGKAEAFFADLSSSSESTFVERARILADRIDTDMARIERVIASHDAAIERRDGLGRELAEAKSRLDRLDLEVSAASVSNETFARSLSDLMTHVEGDNCPVCDRDFSEVSTRFLAAHVADKVANMIEQAGRLQALLQSRTNTQGEVARLDREAQAAASGLISETELSELKTRAADLSECRGRLIQAGPNMAAGDKLRLDAAHAAAALFTLQNADQSAIVLRRSVEDMATRMGLLFEHASPTDDLLTAISTEIDRHEEALTYRQASRRLALDAARSVISGREKQAGIRAELAKRQSLLTTKKSQKLEADKIINVAKDVALQTREARGRVVRRVFNDELNAVWRDLFVRLAPEEPFIPAFAIPDAPNADVEAVLETIHRRGGKGGNPRAMLSAGNLNTAALTLFLALHLSVKRQLPWLIIDDPVQSMDEVHIAQFAALLRTLSKQMQRQVIIAVHERSLFDYLALELSPAFPGDRLNVVELGRNAMGETTCRWDPRLYVADRAIAA